MRLFDAVPPSPSGDVVGVRLLVAYDGRGFRGFALNPGVRTVAGTLGAALEKVLGHRVDLTCAGRTDAGVHAWGQVVTFDAAEARLDLGEIASAVNALCGPEVVVRHADLAPEGFDARHSACSRTYRYLIVNRPEADPFRAHLAWHVATPLDVTTLRLGCDPLIGEHDFSSFCRRPKRPKGEPEASLVRRVLDARWDEVDDRVLRFEIQANAFCHQMVRSIVGTLVDVGRGRLRAGDLAGILRAADRHAAGELAPPHGLCLWEVGYPEGAYPVMSDTE